MSIINLEIYKSKISKLEPLKNSKFFYNSKKWEKLNPLFKDLISCFENKSICREDVIQAYREYYFNKIDVMRPFLITMVWGFADTGYGTHRTNNYISKPENIVLIKKAIDAVSQNNLKTAFDDLKKIDGLGVSYITKILYFASRATNQLNYALIFDIRVATALIHLTTPKEIVELVTINPSSKFADYEKYNALIHSLAEKNNLEAEALEMFLFNKEF